MKFKMNLRRNSTSLSFEKRVTLFIMAVIIFIPFYLIGYPLINQHLFSKEEVDEMSNRFDKIEAFLEFDIVRGKFPNKFNSATLSDIIREESRDNSDLESEIEEIKDLIRALQRDSHYHY